MKRYAVILAALIAACPTWSRAEPQYLFRVLIDSQTPKQCGFFVDYTHDDALIQMTMTEEKGKDFEIYSNTNVEQPIGHPLRLLIDNQVVMEGTTGGELGLVRRGWKSMPEELGRSLMRRLIDRAKDARSVSFTFPGKKIKMPLENLRQAAAEYEKCYDARWQ